MKKTLILLISSLLLLCCSFSKNDGWTQSQEFMLEDKIYKQDGIVTYYFNTDIGFEERESMVNKCKEYIKDNLNLINESEIRDTLHIIFVRDREEMYRYTVLRVAGIYFDDDSENLDRIFCIYNRNKCPIKHELMHYVSLRKWGMPTGSYSLSWLKEGLAVYAGTEDMDWEGYSYEERYALFLQNSKLEDTDTLINNFHSDLFTEDYLIPENYLKAIIKYDQCAYIVEYMIKKYGIAKLRELWQAGMDDFEIIFGSKFEDMILDINSFLNNKYPNPINFDWERFRQIKVAEIQR